MASQQTYPIALAHGIARFDFVREKLRQHTQKRLGRLYDLILEWLTRLGIRTDRLHYFRNIKSHLSAHGFDVHHTSVSYAKSLDMRAGDLKDQINNILAATGAAKVHLIAHSMGGLDARYMIAKLDMAERVASLTTIGTPHLGSSVADVVLNEKRGRHLVNTLKFVIDLRGFGDLTRAACQQFNELVRNVEAANEVFYQTYSSWEKRESLLFVLRPAWKVIKKAEGANDGLVSVASQQWQEEIVSDDGACKRIVQRGFSLPADHLNQVGWWEWKEGDSENLLRWRALRDEYETAIKQTYLDIAEDLKARFPL
jgi:triacylglycerol lipase